MSIMKSRKVFTAILKTEDDSAVKFLACGNFNHKSRSVSTGINGKTDYYNLSCHFLKFRAVLCSLI